MEDIRQNSVEVFDAKFTTNHIRKLKVLLRLLEPSMQNSIAAYIKFMELQYTLQLLSNPQNNSRWDVLIHDSPADFEGLWDELLPYCEPGEQQMFLQIRNLLQTFQNFQGIMEMMKTMKELFPEGMGTGDGQNGFSPEMFAAMSSMFGGDNADSGALGGFFGSNMDLGVLAELLGGGMDLSALAGMFSGN